MKTTRCTVCYAEFSEAEIEGHNRCPACKNQGVPMAIAEDVTIKINWHELRILGIWASNWAARFKPDEAHSRLALQAILQRLQRQYPDKTPLMLFGEVRQLPAKLAERGITTGGVEHNIRPDPLVPLPGGKP